LSVLWRNRGGRLSWVKILALLLAVSPALWLAGQWIGGDLGPRALNAVIHGTGRWAVRFLILTLAITPMRFMFDWPGVVIVRRTVGLTALAYAVTHVSLYVIDQKFDLLHVASEIALRLYLTIGFLALLGLVALGVTSTDAMIRKLGPRWKTLHRALYGITVLALLHHFMQAKADVGPATYVAGLYLWLMAQRLMPARWRLRSWAYAGLAGVATLATIVVEFTWYAVATHIDPWRVLAANWDWDLVFTYLSFRPAHYVAMTTVAAFLIALYRQNRRALARRGTAYNRAGSRL
jgi:sulfoxide reductase heme-binding subunit YedZ